MTKYVIGNKRRIKIDGELVEYDDAKRAVTIKRSLLDIWKGRAGIAGKCMNARCILRNKAKFPHKVLGVSVTRARVFVIDKIDHAVRYILSPKDRLLIKNHDEFSVGEPGTLTLYPPKSSLAAGVTHSSQHRAHTSRRNNKLRKKLCRGERARVMAAVGGSWGA